MSEITNLYVRLIGIAERSLTRSQYAAQHESEIGELCQEIAAAVDAPAEFRLIFDEEQLLATCCARALLAIKASDQHRARLYQQLIGVLLPSVRDHASAAIQYRVRASTSDQDYQPRRGR